MSLEVVDAHREHAGGILLRNKHPFDGPRNAATVAHPHLPSRPTSASRMTRAISRPSADGRPRANSSRRSPRRRRAVSHACTRAVGGLARALARTGRRRRSSPKAFPRSGSSTRGRAVARLGPATIERLPATLARPAHGRPPFAAGSYEPGNTFCPSTISDAMSEGSSSGRCAQSCPSPGWLDFSEAERRRALGVSPHSSHFGERPWAPAPPVASSERE